MPANRVRQGIIAAMGRSYLGKRSRRRQKPNQHLGVHGAPYTAPSARAGPRHGRG